MLQQLRPEDLPVPEEGSELLAVEDEKGLEKETQELVTNKRSAASLRERSREPFRTPESWSADGGKREEAGVQSQGPLPPEGVAGRTEGWEPGWKEKSSDEELQRALEKEMVEKLHRENLELKEVLAEMKEAQLRANSAASSWSEVTGSAVDPPPPPPQWQWSPRAERSDRKEGLRFTPGGTRVPSTPPPDEPRIAMPPWPVPCRYYDKEERKRPCSNEMGFIGLEHVENEVERKRISWNLHPGDCGRGMDSRQEQDRRGGVCQGGNHSRLEINGDKTGNQEGDDVLSATQAKALWLQRELQGLQRMLDTSAHQALANSEYWSKGRVGQEASTSAGAHQECQGDRAYARNREVCQQDRALQGEANHGRDRALQGEADLGRDRAWHGDANLGRDRAWHGDANLGRDRAWHGDTDLGRDRASIGSFEVGDGRARGDRACTGGFSVGDGRAQGERGDNFGVGVDEDKDNLKAVRITLPQLPPHSGQESGIACGDWLVQVRPLVGDMSAGALRWWDNVLGAVTRQYNKWLLADPLERLRLLPPLESDYNSTALCRRLDLRTSTLLLGALPNGLKSELVAARHMSTGAILYRIMRNYQPGGLQEKSETLQALTLTQPGKSPRDATEKLQRWRRHQLRARELCATLPDATILCKSLGVIVAEVLSTAPQASFRLNSFRLQSRLDVMPTTENLEQYYQMLLAEMETLALMPEQSLEGGLAKPAAIKALQIAPEEKGKGKSTTCRNWGTTTGCRFGKRCIFAHPQLPDQADRCFVCSSTEHQKSQCPYVSPGGSGATQQDKGAGDKGHGGSGEKGKGKKGKGKDQKGGGKANSTSSSSTTGDGKGQAQAPKTGENENPKIAKSQAENNTAGTTTSSSAPESTAAGGATGGGTGEMELISEVTTLLRSLRGPQIRAIKLRKVEALDETTMMLDGGATHPLRCATSDAEWQRGKEITVQLAHGSTTMRQLEDCGTLLTRDKRIQPILPLSDLARIGVRIDWQGTECKMYQPNGELLPVHLESGCPVIGLKRGAQLMKEVEQYHRKRCGMRKVFRDYSLRSGEGLCDRDVAKRMMELRALFPHVPDHIAERILGEEEPDTSKVPLNRKHRRRISEASTIVLHLFAGKSTKVWTDLERDGHVVVCLEVEKGQDLFCDHLFGWLVNLGRRGRITMIIGGPPCRTVSLQRYREDGGPRPVRSREGPERYGLLGNTEREQMLVDGDSVLWLRMMYLIYVSKTGNENLETMVEQPKDPEQWVAKEKPRPHAGYASYMVWPETETVAEELNLTLVSFDQGKLEHPHQKPTMALTNVPEVIALDGLTADPNSGQAWPTDLRRRMEDSKEAAQWAPGLVGVLCRAIRRKQSQCRLGPTTADLRENPRQLREVMRERRLNRAGAQMEHHQLGIPDHLTIIHRQRAQQEEALRAVERQVIQQTERSSGSGQAVRALSTKAAQELADWKRHVALGHQPYRRDCIECVQGQGRDRMRRRMEKPDSYCLSVDLAGPYAPGVFQESGSFKYMMVGVFTIPCKDEHPLAEGLQQCGGRAVQKEKSKLDPGITGEPDATGDAAACPRDRCCAVLQEAPDSPVDPLELQAEREDPPTEAEVKAADVMDQQWKEHVEELQDFDVKQLTFVVPLRSRHTSEVIRGMAVLYTRLRSLNLPVVRVHTDRARELISKQMQDWLRTRNIWHTTSAGDEAQGNSRAEAEINIIKGRVRTVMAAAKAPAIHWPLAAYHCGEERLRRQLGNLGIRLPSLLPFGTPAMVKTKRWHRIAEDDPGWASPLQQMVVWGPAWQMSPSSRGYYVEAGGKFYRSTVVVQCQQRPEMVPQVIEEKESVDELFRAAGIGEFSPSEADPEAVAGQEEMYPQDLPPQELHLHEISDDCQEFEHKDPPKRRLHGKQHVVPGSNGIVPLHPDEAPVLRLLRTGGEWFGQVQNDTEEVVDEEIYGKMGSQDREQWQLWQALDTLVHRELCQVVQEERNLTDYQGVVEIVNQAEGEIKQLERRLAKLSTIQEQHQEEECQRQVEEKRQRQLEYPPECLVTQLVNTEEVRTHLQQWEPALREEYDSLQRHGAIEAITEEEFRKQKDEAKEVQVLPALLVATRKPPRRLKARLVACGNYSSSVEGETAAGGVDNGTIRVLLSVAAHFSWRLATVDVKTAFLQAPRRQTITTTYVNPPAILREAGILRHPGERWKVTGALYGLLESPKDWADYRDKEMTKAKWCDNGYQLELKQTPEPHLWQVLGREGENPESENAVLGYIAVYVDDLMLAGSDWLVASTLKKLKETFILAEPEYVEVGKEVTFCGYQIRKIEEGFAVGQRKYISDLLQRRGVRGGDTVPCQKLGEEEEESDPDPRMIKEAQTITGELGWITSRTRPELAFVVALMARQLHRRPTLVIKIGQQVLRYLNTTVKQEMTFTAIDEVNTLKVLVDTSFAPPREQYRSIQGVLLQHGQNVLLWSSSRQPFICQSTAEAELLAYNESVQGAESLAMLLEIFGFKVKR